MRGNRSWHTGRRVALAALLCLSGLCSAAESGGAVTGGNMETANHVPEGYRSLPVTEFVVDAEKNDTYIISIGVSNQRIGQDNNFLTKQVKGNISIYPRQSKTSIYNIAIPIDTVISPSGFRGPYRESVYQGLFYYVELTKGQYLIHTNLYVSQSESTNPDVLVSFERKKFVW